MCGRYTLTSQQGLADAFALATAEPAEPSEWWRPRFNIAPTQPAPIVLEDGGARRLELVRWGLVPSWADSLAVGARMINARVETVADKPAFRDALRHRRCVVPADGFFEWQRRDGKPAPVYLRPVPRRVVGFAGLWERWKGPDGVWIRSFTIVTGPPNELAGRFHDRMPIVLDPRAYAAWLGGGELPPSALAEVLAVPPVADWQAAEVSARVGAVGNDDPGCVEPVGEATPAPPPRQLDLF